MMDFSDRATRGGDVPGEKGVAEAPVARCATCDSGVEDAVFGTDPDGFVVCRECGAPLFYCDVGGEG
jgi:hypothetical protein